MRLTEEEMDRWGTEARLAGMSLSDWIRKKCNGDAVEAVVRGSLLDLDRAVGEAELG